MDLTDFIEFGIMRVHARAVIDEARTALREEQAEVFEREINSLERLSDGSADSFGSGEAEEGEEEEIVFCPGDEARAEATAKDLSEEVGRLHL